MSIGTTLPIESDVSKSRAKLDFPMPLTERLILCALRRENFFDSLKGDAAASPFCARKKFPKIFADA